MMLSLAKVGIFMLNKQLIRIGILGKLEAAGSLNSVVIRGEMLDYGTFDLLCQEFSQEPIA